MLALGTYSWLNYADTRTQGNYSVSQRGDDIRNKDVVPGEVLPGSPRALTAAPVPETIPTYHNRRSSWPSWHSTLSFAWCVGVFLMLSRLGSNLWATARFRGEGVASMDSSVMAVLRTLEARLGMVKAVTLLLHETLPQPASLGFLRPAIILPVSVVTGLDEEHLRAILAHELAHLRRHDYLFNLAQLFVESVLFFNPFVWLLGRTIRLEREACCDRLAAKALENTGDYARALVAASTQFSAFSSPVMNAFGAERSGIVTRVRRLLQPRAGTGVRVSLLGLLAVGGVALFTIVALGLLTDRTVVYTAQLLSPAERVAHIRMIENEAREKSESAITINGQVIDESGEVITGRLSIQVVGHRNSLSTGAASDAGRFSVKGFKGNVVHVGVSLPGYGPDYQGPFTAGSDGVVEGLVFTLPRGMTNLVLLRNEQGEAITGASVTGGYKMAPNSMSYIFSWTTDDNGAFEVVGGTEIPVRMNVSTPGYQTVEKTITLSEGAVHTWILKAGRAVKGVVRSEATGEAIAGARIGHVQSKDMKTGDTHQWGFGIGRSLVSTDDAGAFEINTLKSGTSNIFWIKADGYAMALVQDITEDSSAIDVVLHGGIYLAGVVDLLQEQMPRELVIKTEVQLAEFSYSYYSRTTDVIAGRFHFADLFAGDWRIRKTKHLPETNIQLAKSRDDLILSTPDPAQQWACTLTLTVPEAYPTPEGEIVIVPAYPDPGKGAGHLRSYGGIRFPVIDGIAELKIPMDSVSFSITTNTNMHMADAIQEKPQGLAGYYLSRTRIRRLPSGEYPTETAAPCLPSGAVTVKIRDAQAQPYVGEVALNLHPSRVTNDWIPDMSIQKFDTDVGTKILQSVLLDEDFKISARVGESYLVSPVIRLTAANPVAEVVLQLWEKRTLHGTVLNSEGTPIEGITCWLYYDVAGSITGSYRGVTDDEGRINIQGIQSNPDVEYRLKIRPEDMPYAPREIKIRSFRYPVKVVLEDK
ncbi:MAG: M56 family metallopeptidase [Candidatus Hydrogenedentes bacterium]|nr:M56 family metallopeptidase [Candidatus Hydrogenedentota bacterium]